jgi:hypothetical protein
MERRMNGPTSVIFYCPSSLKGYVVKNNVLRPMPGFYSGDDTAGASRRIYGRRDEKRELLVATR